MITKKNSNISIILTGNIWTVNHINNITKSGMAGIRINNMVGLELFNQNR
jgi:hypothetical protein